MGMSFSQCSPRVVPWEPTNPVLGLLAGPVIDNEHIGDDGAHQLAEGLVIGMHQVFIAILVGLEGEGKQMREALVVVFGADVGAPFEGMDLFDLARQRPEGIHQGVDFGLGGGGLEFKGDHVREFAFANRFGRSADGSGLNQDQRGEEGKGQEQQFHRYGLINRQAVQKTTEAGSESMRQKSRMQPAVQLKSTSGPLPVCVSFGVMI